MAETKDDDRWSNSGRILKASLVVAAVAILLLVLWTLSNVLLLVFASILVAILLSSIADPIQRLTTFPRAAALAVSVGLVAIFIAGFLTLLGAEISSEIQGLLAEFPALLQSLGDQLGIENLSQMVAERIEGFLSRGDTMLNFAGLTFTIFDMVLSFALVIVAGIYFAANPDTYRNGFLSLFPDGPRDNVGRTLDLSGKALRYWLIGQLVAMTIIGFLSWLGLTLLGVPSALALGFIAGVTDFVPVIGPIFGAIPAVLIAFSVSPTTALWVIGLYVLLQQIEGNIVQPLIQKKAVNLPPALTLFSLIGFGALLGPMGILLATPLAVVAIVATKQLYVRKISSESDPET
ncbi:MAG: AI-2E family transporter [Bauldia litoralis]